MMKSPALPYCPHTSHIFEVWAGTSRIHSAGSQQQALQSIGDINCMSFSTNMRFLALGIKDGPVLIHSWPDTAVKAEVR